MLWLTRVSLHDRQRTLEVANVFTRHSHIAEATLHTKLLCFGTAMWAGCICTARALCSADKRRSSCC